MPVDSLPADHVPPERILVLGGTGEARAAADALQAAGHHVVFSLAGVTDNPALPVVPVRRGGFGGTEGLTQYLLQEGITTVLDATHPFAAIMSRQAHVACEDAGVALARLERPPWQPGPDDRWINVATLAEAASVLPPGARVLVTTGRKEIAPFLARNDVSGIIRTIEAPREELPPHWTLLQDRPPFALADERALLAREGVTHLVSKNAGGASTSAKIAAARERGLPVIMVRRPEKPHCDDYPDVKNLLEHQSRWLGRKRSSP